MHPTAAGTLFHRSKAVVAITALRSPMALNAFMPAQSIHALRNETPFLPALQQNSIEAQIIESIQSGDEPLAHMLLQQGADVEAQDEVGCSLLHHAAAAGMLGLMNTLKHMGANENATNIFGESVLLYTQRCNAQVPTIHAPEAEIPEGRNRVRHVVDKLLAWHVNVNEPDQEGCHAAMEAAHAGDLVMLQKLRAAGANMHRKNIYKLDAACYAAVGGHAHVAMQLMQWGVDPRRERPSAYDIADERYKYTRNNNNYLECARIFIRGEITADARELTGLPVRGEDLSLLINDIDAYRTVGQLARESGDRGKAYHAVVLVGSMMGFTPLQPPEPAVFQMARDNVGEALYAAFSQGLHAGGVDHIGLTPAMVHVQGGHHQLLGMLRDAGCDLNAQDALLNSALHYAAEMQNAPAVRTLLAMGANPLLKNWKGLTARQQLIMERQKPYSDVAPAAGLITASDSLMQESGGILYIPAEPGQNLADVFEKLKADAAVEPRPVHGPEAPILAMLEFAEARWEQGERKYQASLQGKNGRASRKPAPH